MRSRTSRLEQSIPLICLSSECAVPQLCLLEPAHLEGDLFFFVFYAGTYLMSDQGDFCHPESSSTVGANSSEPSTPSQPKDGNEKDGQTIPTACRQW